MIAGKLMDSVMGVDVHIVNIPSPAGPIPTPLPHPHVGKFFDPMELLPFVGSTVLVGGKPAAYAGAAGMCVPHIPMGGPFLKPVGNENEIFMGSATVLVADQPMSRMGDMCLSCTCIGAPPPPRKGKDAGVGLMLPTSTLLATPSPKLVLVGGPPTVDMMGMAMSAAGVGFGWLKTTKRWKEMSNGIHAAASKATKHLPENARNKIHKEICDFTGHPVDIVTGKVFTDQVDFKLNGPLPIEWERTWYSTSDYDGPVGQGWHHSYDIWLQFRSVDGAVQLRLGDGRNVYFPFLDEGEDHYIVQERMRIRREGDHLIVRHGDQLHYRFEVPMRDSGERYPVQEIFTLPGHRMHFRYERGLLSAITDAGGKEVRLEHDDAGRIAKVLLPHPKDRQRWDTAATYRYDAVGNLIAVGDAFGHEMTFEYRGHLLVKETDRNGLSFHFTYDGEGRDARCVHTWGTDGLYDHKLVYDLERQVTTVENSRGDVTTHYWTSNGRVFKKVDPLGGSTVFKFGKASEALSRTDELGRTTEFQYDDHGHLIRVGHPDGTEIHWSYEDGQCVGMKDQEGGAHVQVFDEEGRLLKKINSMGEVTSFEYEGPQLKSVSTSGMNTVQFSYDEQRNMDGIVHSQSGTRVRRQFDRRGQLVAILDGQGNTETLQYDGQGRVFKRSLPDGNTVTLGYDREGNLTRYHDRLREVKLTYQGDNKVSSRSVAGSSVSYEYDQEGQVKAIVNEAGERTEFERDPLDRVIQEMSFDGSVLQHEWDAAGRLAQTHLANGNKKTYRYGESDRIEEVRCGSSWERFVYRSDGLLVSAVNQDSEVHFERDLMGRILKEIQSDVVVESERDDAGRLTELRSSLGAQMTYERDVLGHVHAVSASHGTGDWSAEMSFDSLGREVERFMPGDVSQTTGYDRLGRPISEAIFSGGVQTRQRQMKWGLDNRLEALDVAPLGRMEFEHDERGWLVNTRFHDGAEDIRMADPVGNVYRDRALGGKAYGAGGQLLQSEEAHFAYDSLGNRQSKRTKEGDSWTYDWGDDGQLKSVTRPDGLVVRFTYDALGRRLTKTMGGTTTKWVWNGNLVLHEWQESSQNVSDSASGPKSGVSTWVFGPGTFEPMALMREDGCFSITTDYLGTPNAMFDDAGNEVWSMTLDSCGAVQEESGISNAVPFRFAGQYFDSETGLSYNRFRYYDSSEGVYISRDPLGLHGGMPTAYAYVEDPKTQVDPYGLTCGVSKDFDNGASFLITGNAYNRFIKGKPTVGRPDGQFVAPKNQIDDLLDRNKGNVSAKYMPQIERALGIDDGAWANQGGLYRIDIAEPEKYNLRPPDATMSGANDKFLPGAGVTSGGISEGVIDAPPASAVTVTKVL